MTLTLLPTSPSMFGRRACGLGVSAPVHAGLLALVVLLPTQPRTMGGHEERQVAVVPVADAGHPPPRDADLPAGSEATVSIAETVELTPGVTVDVSKIRAHSNVLFPFLTLDLLFLDRINADVRSPRTGLANPLTSGRGGTRASPPLAMMPADLQRAIDLSWSRRDRWSRFSDIRAQVEAHDPHTGGVPALLRAYTDRNILQPFCDSNIRDGRFWAMLENAADHAAFIDFIRSFAREHPSSKATTELLFLLDELVQASRDALLMVLDTDPARDLKTTRAANRAAYDLAVALEQRYRDWLWDRGLHSPAAIRARYDALRLHLLSTIAASTPGRYREADARFLAGGILFNQGKMVDARRWWSGIDPSSEDAYVIAYSDVLRELRSAPEPNARAIARALQAEYGRWRIFSYDRLREFGFRCETF